MSILMVFLTTWIRWLSVATSLKNQATAIAISPSSNFVWHFAAATTEAIPTQDGTCRKFLLRSLETGKSKLELFTEGIFNLTNTFFKPYSIFVADSAVGHLAVDVRL